MDFIITRTTENIVLEVHSDASFADNVQDKFKSSGGYVIYLNKGVVSWKAKKMKYVCSSTAESEYISLYIAAKEALFIGFLLKEAYGCCVFPITIWCDNKAVVDTITNKTVGPMTKFMSTKFYQVIDWVQHERIIVRKIKSEDNVADGMTKVSKHFLNFRDSVLRPRGSVKENMLACNKKCNVEKSCNL